jgi:PilZ domain-containing protein
MEETLGHVLCNPLEEVRLSLRKIRGESNVELRVYRRAVPTDASPLPSTEGVAIPVNVLPELIRVLTQAQDSLTKQGRMFVPSSTETRIMERGELITEGLGERKVDQRGRQYPRVSLNIPVECRLLDPGSIWAGKSVTGDVKDVSLGGAQVFLPKCFPRFRQLDVIMMIEGAPFRARAEVVGTDLMKMKKGQESCRHNLRWVAMDAAAKSALSKVLPAESEDGGYTPR